MKRTITVAGVGEVRAAPDIARIDIGVEASASTARDARLAAAAAAEQLLAALHSQGIASADIATETLSVQPQYDYSGQGPRLTGYLVTNNFRVTLRAIGQAGDVIDSALEAVGDAGRLRAINFDFADRQSLLDRARILAVRDARRRALAYAAGAKVELGDLLSLEEMSEPGAAPRMALKLERAAAATPVEPGEGSVSATVVARFAIAKTHG